MKVTKYIAALALILGMVSCQPEMFNVTGEEIDGETVEVLMTLQFPEPIPISTKGTMGDGPSKTEPFDIHLCLYGPGQGYVQNWITATNVTKETSGNYITGGTFKVYLPITDEKRTIHIIANPPAAVNPTTTDYLDNVMDQMVTRKGTTEECSYWQEIVLENGIHPREGSSSTPPEADATVKGAFANVQLVRNFARIKVEGDADQAFTVKRWKLINVPKKGYIAPYMGKNATPHFPTGYSSAYLNSIEAVEHRADVLYTQLTQTDRYKGYMPNPDEGDQTVIDTSLPEDYLLSGQWTYMYERPLPDAANRQTAILIEVEFLEGHTVYEHYYDFDHEEGAVPYTYWYLVEVLDNHGAYFPILRDFQYTMHIEGIAEKGYDTEDLAYHGSYFGNISASLETAGLSDLSNGESLIHVQTLDYTLFGTTPTMLLENSQFYFVPNTESPAQYYKKIDGVCEITLTIIDVDGFDPAITEVNSQGATDGTGVGTLIIKPAGMPTGTAMKKSIIRITGKASTGTAKELYREIMVTLMNQPSLTWVSSTTPVQTKTTEILYGDGLTPTDLSGVNQPVYLQICLPEGLGASLFPIQLRIEAKNNTLSATSPNLPAKTGPSIFEGKGNTFYYIYTIKYSDYCKLNPRTMKYEYKYVYGADGGNPGDRILFYTNKADNSTETGRHVRDEIMITDMRTANPFQSVPITLYTTPSTNP